MDSEKAPKCVTPADVGVQNPLKIGYSSRIRSGICWKDNKSEFSTFYESIKLKPLSK